MTTTPSPPPPDQAAAPPPRHGGRWRSRVRSVVLDTRPLAHPVFRRLVIGQAAAYVGTAVTEVTIPVQVYAMSHSSLAVGMTGLVGLAPLVFFGLYGGAIADRVDRRPLYLVSSLTTWATTLALLLQAVFGADSVGLVLVLVAVQAAAFAVSSAARGAILPRIVPADLLPAANTLYFSTGTLGEVAGPLLAGALIALPHGYSLAYGVDAALFTLLLYSALRLPAVRPTGPPARVGGLRSVGEGLRFITASPVLYVSFGLDVAAMLLALPTALFPQAAETRFGGGVGVLYAALAAGSLAAGLFSGRLGRVRRQGRALTFAVAGWAAAIALAGQVHHLGAAAALLAAAGAADLVSAVQRQNILQTYVPDALRGRMQGVYTIMTAGGPRLGDLRAGAMASAVGLGAAWSGSALLCVVVALVTGVLGRSFWRYDRGLVRSRSAVAAAPPAEEAFPADPAGAPRG